MNEKDLISSKSVAVAVDPQKGTEIVREKHWEIKAPWYDVPQYGKVLDALDIAGMSYEEAAKAGDARGDQVTEGETDVPMQKGWQNETGGIIQDEHRILRWKNRGEVITVTHLLSSSSITGQEIVSISPSQTRNVVEGIAVFSQEVQSLQNIPTDVDLENNPYLNALADIKKAA